MKQRKSKPWVGKTYKHAYTKSRSVDASCRHGGSCPYCINNRSYRLRKGLVNNPISS